MERYNANSINQEDIITSIEEDYKPIPNGEGDDNNEVLNTPTTENTKDQLETQKIKEKKELVKIKNIFETYKLGAGKDQENINTALDSIIKLDNNSDLYTSALFRLACINNNLEDAFFILTETIDKALLITKTETYTNLLIKLSIKKDNIELAQTILNSNIIIAENKTANADFVNSAIEKGYLNEAWKIAKENNLTNVFNKIHEAICKTGNIKVAKNILDLANEEDKLIMAQRLIKLATIQGNSKLIYEILEEVDFKGKDTSIGYLKAAGVAFENNDYKTFAKIGWLGTKKTIEIFSTDIFNGISKFFK